MKLSPQQLRRCVSPESLGFDTTEELGEFAGILGQPRATKALDFGLAIDKPGYNIFLTGDTGTGRLRYVLDYLEPDVGRKETPPDWLYVNNFDNPLEPRAISMPPKQGAQLRRDIEQMLDSLMDLFPATFDNPSFQQRKTALQKEFDQIYDAAIDRVRSAAAQRQIAMFQEEGSVSFAPVIDGKVVDDAMFASLDTETLVEFRARVEGLEELLNEALLELPQWQRDVNDRMRQLREATIRQALKPVLQPLRQKYQGNPAVSLYLAQIGSHLPRVIEEHFVEPKQQGEAPLQQRKLLESYYTPNLLSTAMKSGAPIVLESNPSYQNLFGRVSYGSEDSGPAYQQITPGSLHRANGGYLIVDIEKLLMNEGTWPAIKRMLRDGCIYQESPGGEIQISGVTPLRPEPIPLKIKVILLGPREVYYTLDHLDRDFNELFRVLVDFESYFHSDELTLKQFGHLLHRRAREANIAELSAAAVARLAEFAYRMAEHQQRLSARIDAIVDIAVEADFERQSEQGDLIDVSHIRRAIKARSYRNSRLRDQMLEQVLDGTMVISSEGTAVGQVNGLSLFQVGDMAFGCPSRITAAVSPGHRGVVDIEREAELGQSVHSKGVMILTGYLSSFYASEFPLAISAHIAMEQSYGTIDGDSASLAELCALVSALVNEPLRQDFAITGSINQRGEIQAVGGVNEKIESFFDVCEARGLSGSQGVILPATNQNNLMLRNHIIEAVEAGQFAIHTVATANDALALLTGNEPGRRNESGQFDPGTLNYRIGERLRHFARLTQSVEGKDKKPS